MDKYTLEALEGSIENWRYNTQSKFDERRSGRKDCPLCTMFNTMDMSRAECCKDCPVYEKTGKKYCSETPYDDIGPLMWAVDDEVISDEEADKEWKTIAENELAFLESLLPEEGRGDG